MSQYANKTGAEIVHDYVVVRGDLSEQYARDQLAEVIDQRTARAEAAEAELDVAVTDMLAACAHATRAEAKIARVEALLADWEWSHSHLGIERANWGPSSRSLRAALADEGDADE